ncbi:MAG: rRNA methyltransferase [Bacillota bacterium]
MWKKVDGRLVPTTDQSRVKFRTNVSKAILEKLETLANENNTHVNYLIESGLKEVLTQNTISFNKDLRPKDRIQYKTTYDKELLESLKQFAKKHELFSNDVIEYSVNYINLENIKNSDFRNRVE